MAETPGPVIHWAILQQDDRLGEQRLVGVYTHPEHASADAVILQADGAWTEVVPYPVHQAPQWSSHREPAWEQTDADFDVPVEVPD